MYKNLLSRKICKKDLIRHCNSKMIIITIPETSKLPISEILGRKFMLHLHTGRVSRS